MRRNRNKNLPSKSAVICLSMSMNICSLYTHTGVGHAHAFTFRSSGAIQSLLVPPPPSRGSHQAGAGAAQAAQAQTPTQTARFESSSPSPIDEIDVAEQEEKGIVNDDDDNDNDTPKNNSDSTISSSDGSDSSDSTDTGTGTVGSSATSKRQMMAFALPALGIFLASPLLSNIDNAFVGKTAGVVGLAALSPATICTDQMLYLFSFLSRATTGIVSRAYSETTTLPTTTLPTTTNTELVEESVVSPNIIAARNAASAPLSVAIGCGIFLSIVYAFFTPNMLQLLNADPSLHPQASRYIYWRGSIAWAALVQNVSLSVMLATRDAISPLKIIGLAAVVNVIGDSLLCVYPLRWGCAGAGAATAFATIFSSAFMVRNLASKNLLPKISLPSRRELKELFDYVGPLFAITITRLVGFTSMQRAAMRCGVQSLAAYQICVNCLIFFLLFGEPLSQLHQTKLPLLIDRMDGTSTLATVKSVLTLGCYAALGVSATALTALTFGTGFFTSDSVVQGQIVRTAPSVAIAIGTAIMGTTIDGAMLASRDFSFILALGVVTCIMQLLVLSRCTTLTGIFLSFAMRLGTYSISAMGRIALGQGALGKVLKQMRFKKGKDD